MIVMICIMTLVLPALTAEAGLETPSNLPNFSEPSKHWLLIKDYVNIWQVSLPLRWGIPAKYHYKDPSICKIKIAPSRETNEPEMEATKVSFFKFPLSSLGKIVLTQKNMSDP